MKVKELIAALEKFDPESEVLGLREIDERATWEWLLGVKDVRKMYRNDDLDESKIFDERDFAVAVKDVARSIVEWDYGENDPRFQSRVRKYVETFNEEKKEVALIDLGY